MIRLSTKLPSWFTKFNQSVLHKKMRLLGLTVLELAIILVVISGGVTAVVVTHQQSSPPTVSNSSTTQATSTELHNPTITITPVENTTSPTSSSSSGSTATKSPAPTTSTPSVTVPTYNACDDGATNDATARENLAQGYYIISDEYISAHVNDDAEAVEANPASETVEENAISDLNSTISEADSQYVQSYNEYVSERQEYNCAVTVSAPVSIPLCATTGEDIVADCISNINANIPTQPSW